MPQTIFIQTEDNRTHLKIKNSQKEICYRHTIETLYNLFHSAFLFFVVHSRCFYSKIICETGCSKWEWFELSASKVHFHLLLLTILTINTANWIFKAFASALWSIASYDIWKALTFLMPNAHAPKRICFLFGWWTAVKLLSYRIHTLLKSLTLYHSMD